MLDERFLYAAIALMLIIIGRDLLKKYAKFDMDKFDVIKYIKNSKRMSIILGKKYFGKKDFIIAKNTGKNNLLLSDVGENKATVMATLRQVTGITYDHAKWIVEATPAIFMTGLSDDEADMTKKALEFVGAKIEIK